MFVFTEDQELLLKKVQNRIQFSSLWDVQIESKLAALVDIYGGYYPDVFERNEKLFIECSHHLVNYCEKYQRYFFQPKLDNEFLCKYREKLAAHLAKINGCPIFNIISSFDKIHLGEAYKNSSERDQKIIAIYCYTMFHKATNNYSGIIDQQIKLPFQYLVDQKLLDKVPEWVQNLNSFTFNSFVETVINHYFNGLEKNFIEESIKINNYMSQLSNDISKNIFIEYLKQNPEIKFVYGLLGKDHLAMLNSQGGIVTENNNYFHGQLNIENRLIDIHFFGGFHGEMSHYNEMATFLKSKVKDIKIPDPANISIVDDELVDTLVQILLSDSDNNKGNDSNISEKLDRSSKDFFFN